MTKGTKPHLKNELKSHSISHIYQAIKKEHEEHNYSIAVFVAN